MEFRAERADVHRQAKCQRQRLRGLEPLRAGPSAGLLVLGDAAYELLRLVRLLPVAEHGGTPDLVSSREFSGEEDMRLENQHASDASTY
jgi:hypothetical protein